MWREEGVSYTAFCLAGKRKTIFLTAYKVNLGLAEARRVEGELRGDDMGRGKAKQDTYESIYSSFLGVCERQRDWQVYR